MKHLFLVQIGHVQDREPAVLKESERIRLAESATNIRSYLGESVPLLLSSNDQLDIQAARIFADRLHSEQKYHEALQGGSSRDDDRALNVETFARVRDLMGELSKQKPEAVILVMHPHLVPQYIGWWLTLTLDHIVQLHVDMEPGSLIYLNINKTGDRTLHACL